MYQKTPSDLQPEDGFIKKPRYVADLITFNYFYIIKVVLNWKFAYILLSIFYVILLLILLNYEYDYCVFQNLQIICV
jgi:hypothetical protein